ncbi:hypothetical protein [Reichenbachiella versicolor]|uniref:hypothetical protein n=1 Tax=Reichenbachiella versicolor TaxID=1821036 RepID=UPI000D6E9A82|nr:hypothetical protein [Reichenbachiella versicolor]
MMIRLTLAVFSSLYFLLTGCVENKDVNSSYGPNFREIHEDIHFHFDEVVVDGNKYLILERDRNNPHEGFGFMALKGNDMKSNQDSIKAYLKTILELQKKILSNQGLKEVESLTESLLENNMIKSKSMRYTNKNAEEE